MSTNQMILALIAEMKAKAAVADDALTVELCTLTMESVLPMMQWAQRPVDDHFKECV